MKPIKSNYIVVFPTKMPDIEKGAKNSNKYESVAELSQHLRSQYYHRLEKPPLSNHDNLIISELCEKLNINQNWYKHFQARRRTSESRDFILALCIILCASKDETDQMLYMCGKPMLNGSNSRDVVIGQLLYSGIEINSPSTIESINFFLRSHGEEVLSLPTEPKSSQPSGIITIKKGKEEKVKYQVQTITRYDGDEIVELRGARGLSLMYDPEAYNITATGRYLPINDASASPFFLTTGVAGNWFKTQYGKEDGDLLQDSIKTYYSVEEDIDLKPYLLSLRNDAIRKQMELAACFNDTRNYICRTSARILDSKIYAFSETFNNKYPELMEYYLVEYKDNDFIFYVYRRSAFMQCYLSKEDYFRFYGQNNILPTKTYHSLDEIQEAKKNKMLSDTNRIIMRNRSESFEAMMLQITNMIIKLDNKELFIRDPDLLDPEQYETYYKITYDGGTIVRSDGYRTDLSFEDLVEGFSYGIDTIEEIESFIKNKNNYD